MMYSVCKEIYVLKNNFPIPTPHLLTGFACLKILASPMVWQDENLVQKKC